MRALIEMVQSAHTDNWMERHARGEVPDALPYGLDRLAGHGIETAWEPRPVGFRAQFARVASRVSGVRLLEGWTVPIQNTDARLCWDERTGIPAALDLRTRKKVPVVSGVIWATDPNSPRQVRFLLRRAFRVQDVLFTLSRAQVSPLSSLTSARVEYIPFGIDQDFWKPSDVPLSEPRLVVSAGNDRHRDFETLFSGSLNDPRNRLEVATKASLPHGPRPSSGQRSHAELRQLFHRASVVAVSTKPNDHCSGITTILEAMACARPVVATSNPGIDEYIEDGVTGVLVPPGDPDALAAAIGDLFRDPGKASEIGSAAAVSVRERFTTQHLSASLADLIKEAVAES